jgi:hypothetical protein
MTTSPQPSVQPPSPQRSPEEWAILVGSITRCTVALIFWVCVTIVSLGLATVVVTAVWKGVTLAIRILNL